VPIEGNHFLLRENANVAKSVGWSNENVFVVDNGQLMEFTRPRKADEMGEGRLTEDRLPTDYVFVDGLGVGDVSDVVLRDRQVLADDGMVVVIAQVERKSGKLVGSPDIISRGFIFMKENKDLIQQTRSRIKKIIIDHGGKGEADIDNIKNKLRNDIGQFLFQKTERRPMVLPVVIEV
jgi:ribonuclease J